MLVKDLMDHHPPFIDKNMPVAEARRLMGELQANYLPVVGDGKTIQGLVTRQTLMFDPDLLGSLDLSDLTQLMAGLKVNKAMIKAKNVVSIGPNRPIEEASQQMVDEGVGCLPVVEGGSIKGLINRDDLLIRFTQMLAGDISSIRATMRMKLRKGEFAKLISAISEAGWGIVAAGGVPDPKREGHWLQVIKIRHADIEDVRGILTTVVDQEIVDLRKT